jgi:hypothetical protein
MRRWGEQFRDVQWIWDLPISLASLFDYPMDVLREWSAAVEAIEIKNLDGLNQCLVEAPRTIDNLDFDLIEHSDELSAVAAAPIVLHDICAANTATFVLEYCWRYFDWLFDAVGVHEVRIEDDLLKTFPEIDHQTAPLPRLTTLELRRLEAMLEQEVCRAYDRRLVTGRATPEDRLADQSQAAPNLSKPSWNKPRGQLTYADRVIRSIRRLGNARNVVLVFDALQEQNWPDRIDDPLPGGQDSQRLHETIRSLNTGLRGIRFRADGTGRGILWEPVAKLPDDSPVPPGCLR